MKCAVCNGNVEETFLNKISGTFIKKKPVCIACQKSNSMEELKKKFK